ncbi:MAG: crossover junction endodeoxyribonuclease RuvC [Myxococcales bacterium]|nr:crossover junction endodeoxyribonuclease RuvC [Myxococcales bacterium]
MIVLGVDPGLAALGYGVITVEGKRMTARTHGVFRTKRRPGLSVGRDLTIRIGELARAFEALLDEQHPEAASIEEFRFYGKAVTSSLQVANVVGMLREALRAHGVPVAEYSAQDIKRAVTGYANAEKVQVQKMVKLQLAMAELPKPEHAADALAAAITHACRLPMLRATGGAR